MKDEELWAGWFGVQYTTKFMVDWRRRVPFMQHITERTKARSVLDVGTNSGWNLRALQEVDETLELRGVEINPHTAASALIMGFNVDIIAADKIDARDAYDLVMTSGVLIHVRPELIETTMRAIITASRRWVLAIEYGAVVDALVREPRDGAPRTWARPFGAMYEALGLHVVETGAAGDAYPECQYWLMEVM